MLPSGKLPRIFIGLAVLLAALLLLDLATEHNAAKSLLYSNSLDLAMVLLASVCSFHVTRRSSGYLSRLWILLGIGLGMQTVAQAITTYYQSFVPGYTQLPLPSDVLFFAWAAPIFMMFLPDSGEHSNRWDWLRMLDFAQVAIVTATAYLYFFYVPSRWEASGNDLPRQILMVYLVRDAVLSLGFLFRSRTNSAPAVLRSFSLGLFFVFLACAATDADYLLTLNTFVGAASWGDLLYLLPYFLIVVIAARWKYTKDDALAGPISGIGNFAATHVLPVGIPLLVIFMGRRIARDQVTLAWLAVAASFLCAALRLILTNRKQSRISENLQATEQALRRSEHMLALAFRFSPDGFSINVFPNGAYLEVNDSFTRLTGYAREEVLGKSPVELNLWLDPSLRGKFLDRLTEAGELRDAEFRFRKKDGQIRMGLLSGSLLELDGQRCSLVAVRDITDRKASEELLRSSEERFRSLVEHIHVGIVWFDFEMRLQYANQAAQDMFGVKLEDIRGKNTSEMGFQPLREDGSLIPDAERPLRGVITGGQPLFSQVFGWRRPRVSGILWTLMDAIPQFDSSGSPTRVLVSLTNITEQREAANALRESEGRFRTLVRDLHVGVVLHGPDGAIEFANKAALGNVWAHRF